MDDCCLPTAGIGLWQGEVLNDRPNRELGSIGCRKGQDPTDEDVEKDEIGRGVKRKRRKE
jgi:hypothetical protein